VKRLAGRLHGRRIRFKVEADDCGNRESPGIVAESNAACDIASALNHPRASQMQGQMQGQM